MTYQRFRPAALSLLAWVVLSGCQKSGSSDVTAIRVDGSSTVAPITAAVAREFQKTEQVRTAVEVSGTSAGFTKFCSREVDICGASRPIKPSEVEQCDKNKVEYVELPVAYDGISITVHPKNSWANSITVAELSKIWSADSSVHKWSDVRADWPDRELHLYGAGTASGTYDYFSLAVSGKEKGLRKDFKASEDDEELVRGVAGDELSLGFFGFAYYVANKPSLKALGVDDGRSDNGNGAILPEVDTIRRGTYQPLARPLFIYVAKASLERPSVSSFVSFYLQRGQQLVTQARYVPLPSGAYALGIERLAARRTGSIFGGKGALIGVSIEQLLQKEAESNPAPEARKP